MNKLNIGAGQDIKEGWDNVDKNDFDLDIFPYPLKKMYDKVLIKNVLEHTLYPEKVLLEIARHCSSGAEIIIECPHYTNKGSWGDFQHLHYFSEKAFERFHFFNPRFVLIHLEIVPTSIGKFVPFKDKFSLVFNGLYSKIIAVYKLL